ncbi:MAG: hypothetical protein H6732_12060 [Alphaproteobacteria bacterium]|nr:hypothetical protein [Alphaproteobacteria bacterium]
MHRLLPLLLAACAVDASKDADDTDPGTDTDGPDVDPADADGDGTVTAAEWVAFFEVPGPHDVGFRLTEFTYADPTTDAPRTLRLSLWFPTDATGAQYATFTGPLAPDDVLLDPVAADGTFPLAVFSHGHQGDMDNCAHVMTRMASHGWVVAAPEHTGNTLKDGGGRTTEIYVQRPFDVSATLDHLLQADPLAPQLDGRVYATGHSFGGYTTFLVAGAGWDVDHWDPICQGSSSDPFCSTWSPKLTALMRQGASDDRVLAAATLSGGNWGQLREAGLATVDRPLLQLSGALDGSVTNDGSSDPIWRDLPAGDKVRADLAHGDHQSYTDFAGAGAGIIPGTSRDALEGQRSLRLVEVYLLAFGAKHVLAREGLDPVLDGTLVVDEDVTLSTK